MKDELGEKQRKEEIRSWTNLDFIRRCDVPLTETKRKLYDTIFAGDYVS